MRTRTAAARLAALTLVASACAAGGGDGTTAGRSGGDTRAPDDAGAGACSPTTSDVEPGEAVGPTTPFPWDDPGAVAVDGFDTDRVRRGGPPPDGIRPIDTPCVEPVPEGGAWLADEESVLVVEVEGEARAYPLAIMTQHEVVNDHLGGVPLTVTYCPLCNSGIAFERTIDGEVWDFGTSGRLLDSNLVMYDRQTRTLWSQFSGEAIWGDPDVVGTALVRVPTQVLAWSTFRSTFPGGTVLGRASMPGREYGRNPYPGYEDSPSNFLFDGATDQRLDPDERVVGVGEGDHAVALPLDVLAETGAVTVAQPEGAVTVVWAPGQASAIDRANVRDGRDVGQTGAVHDITGATVEGDQPPLRRVALDDTFWFVWFAFQPDTTVVTE